MTYREFSLKRGGGGDQICVIYRESLRVYVQKFSLRGVIDVQGAGNSL